MAGAKQHVNYYEILEVARDAPQHEVHRAYTRAKATYTQDNPALYSMFTQEEARDILKLIEEAYAVLGNHGLRRNYDTSVQRADHSALPDIAVPTPEIAKSTLMDPLHAAETGRRETVLVTNGDFTVRTREANVPLMPPDTGKCPLGTFKIDNAIEAEIANQTEFDGPFLKKVRLYKQVSLEKLSIASRIGKTYLIALEANDFKNLPAPVFLRGFLVQMGKQLGLDEQKVAASYMALAKASGKYGS